MVPGEPGVPRVALRVPSLWWTSATREIFTVLNDVTPAVILPVALADR